MNFENKNFIAAILLSMAIIFGWQYFYAAPLQKKLTAETQTAQTQQGTTAPSAPAAGGAVPNITPEALAADRAAAIAASPRLAFKTDFIEGSINLKGAMIDDLHLLRYRETIDPKSPTITSSRRRERRARCSPNRVWFRPPAPPPSSPTPTRCGRHPPARC